MCRQNPVTTLKTKFHKNTFSGTRVLTSGDMNAKTRSIFATFISNAPTENDTQHYEIHTTLYLISTNDE